MDSSSRDHAHTAGSALDLAALREDIMRRFPRTLARLHLAELVEGISPENRHPEIDTGPPVGREFGAEGWND